MESKQITLRTKEATLCFVQILKRKKKGKQPQEANIEEVEGDKLQIYRGQRGRKWGMAEGQTTNETIEEDATELQFPKGNHVM